MMNDCRMSADRNCSIPQPSHTFAYILNIFACDSHNNIIGIGQLLLFGAVLADESESLIGKQAVSGIDLPIVDTGDTFRTKIFLLKVSAS